MDSIVSVILVITIPGIFCFLLGYRIGRHYTEQEEKELSRPIPRAADGWEESPQYDIGGHGIVPAKDCYICFPTRR